MAKAGYILRKDAADLLKVSLRTLDRYIRNKNIRHIKEGKNIFIVEEDILRMKRESPVDFEIYQNQESVSESPKSGIPEAQIMGKNPETLLIFEKLVSSYERQIAQKDEKIEVLQHQVGQLEGKLQGAIPLLEYRNKTDDTQKVIEKQSKEIIELSMQKKYLKITKNIAFALFALTIIIFSFLAILVR